MTTNAAWVVVAALNLLVLVGIVVGVIWTIRQLRMVSALERRIRDLEDRLNRLDGQPPTR